MTRAQRQSVFDRLLDSLARQSAESLGLGFVGTLTQLAPPPLPGQPAGETRYYVNTLSSRGSRTRLVDLPAATQLRLRRAEAWVSTGEGTAPAVVRRPGR